MSEKSFSSPKRVAFIALASLLSIGLVSYLSTQPHQSMAHALSKSKIELAKTPMPGDTIMKQDNPHIFLSPVPVGKKAPDFSVKDASGQTLTLSEFQDKKNVVLVFYQGDFCRVCGAQLDNLQSHLKDFEGHDTAIIAISSDDMPHAQKTFGEHGLSFSVVPDQHLKIINQFGVPNIKRNIAWPSVFVIDKQGIVQLSHADPDFKRLYSEDILQTLEKITKK